MSGSAGVSDRFIRQQWAGEGPSGHVWNAIDRLTGRRAVLYEHRTRDPDRCAQLARECDRAAAITHPAVGAILGCEHRGDRFRLAVQYVPSRSLSTVLAKGPLPVRQALDIVGDVLDSLAAGHRIGVIHGAVEPGLVRLTDAGAAILYGHGLYVGGEEDEQPERFAHRRAFRAPEMLAGATPSPAADQYSAARLLVACLTGMPDADLDQAWPADGSADRPRLLRAVERALKPDPGRRWPSTTDLRAALEAACP